MINLTTILKGTPFNEDCVISKLTGLIALYNIKKDSFDILEVTQVSINKPKDFGHSYSNYAIRLNDNITMTLCTEHNTIYKITYPDDVILFINKEDLCKVIENILAKRKSITDNYYNSYLESTRKLDSLKTSLAKYVKDMPEYLI